MERDRVYVRWKGEARSLSEVWNELPERLQQIINCHLEGYEYDKCRKVCEDVEICCTMALDTSKYIVLRVGTDLYKFLYKFARELSD